VLPVAGGLLFAVLIGVWYTSAVWLYRHATSAAPAYQVPSPIPVGANAAAGATVFASAGCGSCHTLAAAHAAGQVGPNLDKLQPAYQAVVSQVTSGGGLMPSYKRRLSAAQIRDVAAFVAKRAGG